MLAELLLKYVPNPVVDVLAAPGDPVPDPNGPVGNIDTESITKFIVSTIAPIIVAVIGLVIIGRAGKGEVSKVMTTSAIAIVGIMFIVGAATLMLFGGKLVDLIFA